MFTQRLVMLVDSPRLSSKDKSFPTALVQLHHWRSWKGKKEIEDWVAEVISKAPATRFVIEASIHEADLDGKEGLIPEIPNFFDGAFCMQGGIFGGRAFTPEALLDQDRNPGPLS